MFPSTQNSPISMAHTNFLEPTLILIMGIHVGYIDFQPTPNLEKVMVAHISVCVCVVEYYCK